MLFSKNFIFLILIIIYINYFNYSLCETSKLVKIACSRSPELSFCNKLNITSSTTNSENSESDEKDEGKSIPELPTLEEEVEKSKNDTTLSESKGHENDHDNEEKDIGPKSIKTETSSKSNESSKDEKIGRTGENLPSLPKLLNSSESVENVDEEEEETNTTTQKIPDDPILEESLPNRGSLLRLPKPQNSSKKHHHNHHEDEDNHKKDDHSDDHSHTDDDGHEKHYDKPKNEPEEMFDLITPPPLPPTKSPDVPKPTIEKGEYVEVYITKFCIDNRKDFITKCRLKEVNPLNVDFCKSYPIKCTSNEAGVIPLLAYCEQFIHNYVKICSPHVRRNKKQKTFCKAYDQFCVPPPTPEDLMNAAQNLVRCEDIVNEARKICNPFPQSSDRLNYLRCTQFFKFCGKYVDWV